jgi:hypothetical protein
MRWFSAKFFPRNKQDLTKMRTSLDNPSSYFLYQFLGNMHFKCAAYLLHIACYCRSSCFRSVFLFIRRGLMIAT